MVGVMTLWKGAVLGQSTRQNLNMQSSTEGELVGVKNLMPHILWTGQFLMSQGLKVTDTVVYQENKSAILLKNKGLCWKMNMTL